MLISYSTTSTLQKLIQNLYLRNLSSFYKWFAENENFLKYLVRKFINIVSYDISGLRISKKEKFYKKLEYFARKFSYLITLKIISS